MTRRVGHSDLLLLLFLGLVTAAIMFPIAWMVSFSLRTNLDASVPGFLPPTPTLENYLRMWSVAPFVEFFRNSVLVTLGSVIVALVLGTPAAYALARLRVRGRAAVTGGLVFSQVLPVALLVVPLFLLARRVGIYDSVVGLVIVYVGLLLPLTVLLLRSFFVQIPIEVEEAASVDGASVTTVFRSIALPLARPGLVTAAIFVAVVTWEEYLIALTLTTSSAARTLPVGLTYFTQQYGTDYAGLMAASVVSSIPMLILFMFLGRYFVRNISAGAVTG